MPHPIPISRISGSGHGIDLAAKVQYNGIQLVGDTTHTVSLLRTGSNDSHVMLDGVAVSVKVPRMLSTAASILRGSRQTTSGPIPARNSWEATRRRSKGRKSWLETDPLTSWDLDGGSCEISMIGGPRCITMSLDLSLRLLKEETSAWARRRCSSSGPLLASGEGHAAGVGKLVADKDWNSKRRIHSSLSSSSHSESRFHSRRRRSSTMPTDRVSQSSTGLGSLM